MDSTEEIIKLQAKIRDSCESLIKRMPDYVQLEKNRIHELLRERSVPDPLMVEYDYFSAVTNTATRKEAAYNTQHFYQDYSSYFYSGFGESVILWVHALRIMMDARTDELSQIGEDRACGPDPLGRILPQHEVDWSVDAIIRSYTIPNLQEAHKENRDLLAANPWTDQEKVEVGKRFRIPELYLPTVLGPVCSWTKSRVELLTRRATNLVQIAAMGYEHQSSLPLPFQENVLTTAVALAHINTNANIQYCVGLADTLKQFEQLQVQQHIPLALEATTVIACRSSKNGQYYAAQGDTALAFWLDSPKVLAELPTGDRTQYLQNHMQKVLQPLP